MSELNINVAGGSSTRLLTAGKYCDKDILIVASGSEAEPAVIEALEITANGTYTAPEGVDGYSPVTVNVPQEGGLPAEALVITGNCSGRFINGGWDWFIKLYGNQITTKNISKANEMFEACGCAELPFNLNFIDGGCDVNNMFSNSKFVRIPSIDFNQNGTLYKATMSIFSYCHELTEIGKLSNFMPNDMSYFFSECRKLRYLPEIENWDFGRLQSYAYASVGNMFTNCYSLRSIPESFLKELYGIQNYSYVVTNKGFQNCASLDEIRGLRGPTNNQTANMFQLTFNNCARLKDIIFATDENGYPYTANWKNQVIDLGLYIGYSDDRGSSMYKYIINFNSGITEDKLVNNDETYQALKDDPDWFTTKLAYSRYNHDSAVNTINSLPDVSASGGTNTIKFQGNAGSATDGGAINTLTTAEIAVATAKGWTVSFV